LYKIINRKKLIAVVTVDTIGKALFAPLRLFRKRELLLENIRDILVIRTAYIGDVIMTLPILKPLKERFPGTRITFLTASSAQDILRNNPYVDEVLTYDAFWFYPTPKADYLKFLSGFRKRAFDLVIEARADIRDISLLTWPAKARYKLSYDVGGGAYLLTHVAPYRELKHKVEYHLDLIRFLGGSINRVEWGIYLTENEKQNTRKLLKEHGIEGPYVCAHPGARLSLKRWPMERCAELYDRIIENFDLPLVILGAKDEKELADGIAVRMERKPVVLAGKVDLRGLAGILADSALFICNDSAPMHVAASMGTPTVSIFGPSKSVETSPYGNASIVVEKDFSCRYSCDESSCRFVRYHACMLDIQVQDVYGAVSEILGASLRSTADTAIGS
jgi:ADP-heptose:LPS heptosyltransferase